MSQAFELRVTKKDFKHLDRKKLAALVVRDDRQFSVGDRLLLREYDAVDQAYTGRELVKVIDDIFTGSPEIPDHHYSLILRHVEPETVEV